MYLLIDNYDSFTYNLYALFCSCGAELKVIKNDEYINADDFEGLILSPGPSNPSNSKNSLKYIAEYAGKKPIFGVCLGMQIIGYHLGYNIKSAKTIQHGKTDTVIHNENNILFKNVPKEFTVVRYHSLAVDINENAVTSRSAMDQEVMSIEFPEKMLFGVQFHPESVSATYGEQIVKNYMDFTRSL